MRYTLFLIFGLFCYDQVFAESCGNGVTICIYARKKIKNEFSGHAGVMYFHPNAPYGRPKVDYIDYHKHFNYRNSKRAFRRDQELRQELRGGLSDNNEVTPSSVLEAAKEKSKAEILKKLKKENKKENTQYRDVELEALAEEIALYSAGFEFERRQIVQEYPATIGGFERMKSVLEKSMRDHRSKYYAIKCSCIEESEKIKRFYEKLDYYESPEAPKFNYVFQSCSIFSVQLWKDLFQGSSENIFKWKKPLSPQDVHQVINRAYKKEIRRSQRQMRRAVRSH